MTTVEWDAKKMEKIAESVGEFRRAYTKLKRENESQKSVIEAQNEHIKKTNATVEKFKLLVTEKKGKIIKHFQSREDALSEERKTLSNTANNLSEECRKLAAENQKLEQKIESNETQISELEKEVEIVKSQMTLQQDHHDFQVKKLEENHQQDCDAKIKLLEEKHRQEIANLEEKQKVDHDKQASEIMRLKKLLSNNQRFENSYPWKFHAKNIKTKGKIKIKNNRFPGLVDFFKSPGNHSKVAAKKRKLFMEDPEEVTDLTFA